MARLALVLLFALLGIVVAQTSTFSNEICSTRYARSSVQPVPSTTTTRRATLTAFRFVCQTVTSTVTPATSTTTITDTSTSTTIVTLPESTDTFTITSLFTTTSTQSQSVTSISTVVTTTTEVTTSTSTVATPAGFTPVALEDGYAARRKRGLSKRCRRKKTKSPETPKTPETNNSALNNTIKRVGNRLAFFPIMYPQAVTCRDTIEVVVTSSIIRPSCRTTPTTTITLPTITSTVRASTTTVVTSTASPPDASTTITTSSTVTVMTTTTSTLTSITTSTSTSTSIAPAQTTYAACSANNLVNSANGGHAIEQLFLSGPLVQANVGTAYDCCVSCMQTTNCVGSGFAGGQCNMVVGTTCDATSQDQGGFGTADNTDLFLTISNGPCGQLGNQGDQPDN
ncbi:hypothetical protein NW762_014629 [Fusarium torreyae]|uniref:Apple domain-containing protein n=1 Tax=Fusarium torreyae TaxID=1237075 RepID=A0A9W8RME0_9HYPO|nr:hypothetical protein NW762_014629 [Fusarium torreyae]